jgi:hypothetical protein
MERFTDKSGKNPVGFSAATPEILIVAVQKHRRATGVEISDYDTALEIAKANKYLIDGNRYSKIVEPKKTYAKISLGAAISACSALVNVAKGNIVSDAEINRRWLICKSCPSTTTVSDCMSCGGAGKASALINRIRGTVGKSFRIEQEAGRTFCGECGCSHALMIPTLLEKQKQESDVVNEKRPSQCWMRRDSKNYKPEAK